MNLGPIAGLIGAAVASLSVFKWILGAFIIVMIVWIFASQKSTRNALDARALKDLIKSSQQWAARSEQDGSPLVSLMNANYAMAYFNVARSIGSDQDIYAHTHANVDSLIQDIETTQKRAVEKVTKVCPSVAPSMSKFQII